jgi:hypothetical protein
MAGVRPDPLAPLVGLPGVEDAVRRAREAVVALHRHPVNRTGWAASAAEAALRAARASAALDGAELARADGVVTDPVLAGAVRAAEATGRLLGTWRTAPLQALARLHVLAAADLVSGPAQDALGRPRVDPSVSARLLVLAGILTGRTALPAVLLTAVVHGEMLALSPFGTADGVVARAAARLTAIATGLDAKGLAVPEVGHLRRAAEYRRTAAGFGTGEPAAVAAWLVHCCQAWEEGASEAMSIAGAAALSSSS